MSGLAEQRAAIASALSPVPGVTGHVRRPATPNVGDAWPVLRGGTRAQGTAFIITWGVRVFTPQEEEAASEWWDAHWEHLFFALEPIGFVGDFEPVLIDTQAGSQLAFQIMLQTEE